MYELSEILANTKPHPFKSWYKIFSVLFGKIQFCSSTSRSFPQTNGECSGRYGMVDLLIQYTSSGTAPPQPLHGGAAPQVPDRRCDASSACSTLVHNSPSAHTLRRYLRVVSRLGYCCIYNTCMYDACYSYGLPLFCRLACCWNYV